MVANWLSGHTRAAFLFLAFVGCGEAFTGGGNEGGEGGAPPGAGGGSSGASAAGTGGAGGASGIGGAGGTAGAGATGGQAGSAGSPGGGGGVSGAGALGGSSGSGEGGEPTSEAGAGHVGHSGTGGAGDSGGANEGGAPAAVGGAAGLGGTAGTLAGVGGVAGTAGTAATAGTGGIVVEPGPPKNGLMLWLRADLGVTANDDGAVLSWEDQSGRGHVVEQTGSDQRPQLVNRGEGGMPRVEFDGEDDFMRIPPGFEDFSAGLSAFAVTNARSLDKCWAVFELSNGSEIDDIYLGHYDLSPHYEVFDVWMNEGDYPVGDDFVLSVVHSQNEYVETRTNGSLAGDHTIVLPTVVERTQNYLGRSQYQNCNVLEGSISEFLLYNRAVSNEELLEIEDYLATRWSCCRE